MLSEESLQETALWQRAAAQTEAQFPNLDTTERLSLTVRNLLDVQVEDVVRSSSGRLDQHQPGSPRSVMDAPERIIGFSPDMQSMQTEFHDFLFAQMYFHPAVAGGNQHSVRLMRKLFLQYVDHPDSMGRKAQARIPSEGLHRTACDYVSGMTDRYAYEEILRFDLEDEDPSVHPNIPPTLRTPL